jgi:hypothetical protein
VISARVTEPAVALPQPPRLCVSFHDVACIFDVDADENDDHDVQERDIAHDPRRGFLLRTDDMRSSDPFSAVVPLNPPSLERESDSRELQ